MGFKLIACINKRGVIGRNHNLLFHISNDMKNFKSITTGNVVIMGRSTFETFPNRKPLKNRINIILTSNTDYSVDAEYDNVYIAHTIADVIDICKTLFPQKQWFVIGGASVYNQFLVQDLVDTAIITCVSDTSKEDGDAVMMTPWNETDGWRIYFDTYAQRQRENGQDITYKYTIYKRKENL